MCESDGNDETLSSSLLVQLRRNDPEAWTRLTRIFGPLVYHWCRRAGCGPNDSADITQEVFRTVSGSLPSFSYDRPDDTFRGWLATITRHKIIDQRRRQQRQVRAEGGSDFHHWLQRQVDTTTDDGELTWVDESADRAAVVRRASEQIQGEFELRTWQMFWRTAVEDESPADVARDFGVSVHAVYKAKSRVMQRLRIVLEGMV
jgi:RNA polymerase sigma-70 factor (ECF subfamily)